MSIFAKVVDEVKMTIPPQILQVAFRDNVSNWRKAPVSLDDMIMNKVIKPRVLVDANLVGGQISMINLANMVPKYSDNASIVYELPPEATQNREIISVLSVNLLPYVASGPNTNSSGGISNVGQVNDISSVSMRVMDSHSNMPVVSTAHADLIGYNTVLIRNTARAAGMYQLRCILSNSENLNNINPRSWLSFTELCVLAVKSYIYNNLIISIDSAYLTGGQELGAVKNYVEGLSDSESMYRTYLNEVWAATAFCNDTDSFHRLIRAQFSPGL